MKESKVPATPLPATYKNIALSDIVIGKFNPRKDFNGEASQDMINSVRENGVLQPVLVRPVGKKYELVYGERRFRASESLKLSTIPATIRDLTDDQVIEIQIIENLQRKDVHPMEEAAAFKSLISNKKFTVQEIAKRVGKSDNYVASRLKLNDLIPEFQKVFFKNDMTLISAMKLIRISKDGQKDIWEDDYSHQEDPVVEIKDWEVNNYQGDLMKAPFDTKDPSLNKPMGSCGSCPHNTASNTVLFPEAIHAARCMNIKCFKLKADIFFTKELKVVQEDPSVLLITTEHNHGKRSAELTKKGNKVYASQSYEKIEAPDAVDESDIEREDFDSKKEHQEAIAEAYKDYDKELAEYNKKVASGKLHKAFVVEGNEAGRYIHIALKKTTEAKGKKEGTIQSKDGFIEANIATPAEIEAEIKRLGELKNRKHEIENEKIAQTIYALIEEKEDLDSDALSKPELVATIMKLMEHTNFDQTIEEKFKFKGDNLEFLNTKTESTLGNILNAVIRGRMIEDLRPKDKYDKVGDGYLTDAMVEFVRVYNPKEVKDIEQQRDTILAAYDEKVKVKIAVLKAQLRPSPKGKGLKALLPDAK